MNYCYNCGANLNEHEDSKYCWNCGSKLKEDNKEFEARISTNNKNTNPSPLEVKKSTALPFKSFGIIYTNIRLLSIRLNCDKIDLINTINNYISRLEILNHKYVLLDADKNEKSSLTGSESWNSHVDLLNYFNKIHPEKEKYLFIIGGHDIIPMAIINNEPRCYNNDYDIETDMPYSYLNQNFEELLWSGQIFKEEVALFCGRIPMPNDKSLVDLENYFNRTIENNKTTISPGDLFGISAKSWERASNKIISNVSLSKELHTSPEHNLNSTEKIFNNSASLYYFNLHGSDSPGSPEYFGDNSPVITPRHLNKVISNNLLFTEACYGAKFIDYSTEDSMLLSSIYNKTVAFVGSSRVAFGSATENISSADIVAKSFIEHVLSGKSCGNALSLARVDVFDACPDDHFDYGTTSAAEFNLFGDPIFSFNSNLKEKSIFNVSSKPRSKSISKFRPEKLEINIKQNEKGVLFDIRNVVNMELRKINDFLNKELYAQFNIEPKNLSSVFQITNKYGEKTYNYNYYKSNTVGITKAFAIFTDKNGKIKTIIQSK